MSGLPPFAVYLSAALIGGIGVAYLIARLRRVQTARSLGIAWLAVSFICLGFLALDRLVGVAYSQGLYMAISLTVLVGTAAGLALRRAR